MSDFTIRSLTPETFDDFAALVERNKGMFASCWCTWFHPDDREPMHRIVSGAAARHASFSCEFRAMRWDGAYRWLLSTGRPRHGAGAFLGFIGAVVDITERRQLERRIGRRVRSTGRLRGPGDPARPAGPPRLTRSS